MIDTTQNRNNRIRLQKNRNTLTLKARRHAIGEILEARFSVSAFEHMRRQDAGAWASPRYATARDIHGQAMRKKQWLQAAPDAQIVAEIAAIRVA